jgi:hypothetical protein
MAGVETCSNQGHLEGSSVTPGGVQLSSKNKKNSAKIPDNPKTRTNVEPKSFLGLTSFCDSIENRTP